MGAKIKISISRQKLYDQDFRKDKLIKLSDKNVPNITACEFLYNLLERKVDNGS